MLPSPDLSRKLLTNEAYGFPRGAKRRVEPIALLCIHVTDNPQNPPASAIEERKYANREGSNGPSAHYYVDRDGSAVMAVGVQYAAWSNGDLRSPHTEVPGIPAVVSFAERYNANEAYALEIECCGRYPEYAIEDAQIRTVAYLAAVASSMSELPIERSTIHLHSDLNSETRNACPAPRERALKLVDRVIELASLYAEILELRAGLTVSEEARQAAEADVVTYRAALEQSEQLRVDGLATIIRWEEYGQEVTSRAGGILGLDRPGQPK
jgi:hypothetical protein